MIRNPGLVVEFDDVSIRLHKRTLLTGVTARFDRGVTVALGPAGSGTTALVRAVATELPITAGRLTIGGLDVAKPSDRLAARALVAHVPRSPTFPTGFSVVDVLAYAAWLGKVSVEGRSGAIEASLRAVELDSTRGRSLAELSPGQRRRVFLAMAIVAEPAVLVVDEVMCGADDDTRRVLGAAIRRVGSSATVIVASHDRAEVDELEAGVVEMRGGTIVRRRSGAEDELGGQPELLGG